MLKYEYVFQFLMEHPIRRIVYSEKQPKVHMESALRMITFHVLWGIVQMVQIFSVPNSICMKSRKIITFKYILSKSKNANGKNWFIIGTHIWNILHTFYDDICFVSCFRSFHLICHCKEEYYSIFWKCAIFTTYEILVKFQLIIWEKGSYSMKQINTH